MVLISGLSKLIRQYSSLISQSYLWTIYCLVRFKTREINQTKNYVY